MHHVRSSAHKNDPLPSTRKSYVDSVKEDVLYTYNYGMGRFDLCGKWFDAASYWKLSDEFLRIALDYNEVKLTSVKVHLKDFTYSHVPDPQQKSGNGVKIILGLITQTSENVQLNNLSNRVPFKKALKRYFVLMKRTSSQYVSTRSIMEMSNFTQLLDLMAVPNHQRNTKVVCGPVIDNNLPEVTDELNFTVIEIGFQVEIKYRYLLNERELTDMEA